MSYKLSLLKLETPYKLSDHPIRTQRKINIYPASKTLIKKFFPPEVQNFYENKIKQLNINPIIYHNDLRPYQNEDVCFMRLRKVVGNFNQQRLGKTPATILTLANEILYKKKKVLIIAPKSTLYNWQKDFKKWIGVDAYVIRGPAKQREKSYIREQVIITTYDTAAIDKKEGILPFVDVVVLDEAHRLRNFKGQRSNASPNFTKQIMYIGYQTPRKIVLSGTPSPNYSYNIFPILHFLFPTIFSSYWQFVEYYYETEEEEYNHEGDKKKNILGFKKGKQQELVDFLDMIATQKKRKDYMKWIPPVDDEIIELEPTKDQHKYIEQLLKTWEIEEAGILCQGDLDLMLRLRQLAIDPKLIGLKGKSNKTQFILDYIKDYPEDSILIISFFTSYLKELQKEIPNSKLLIGEISTKQRKQLENEFNQGLFPILLGNIDVVKEGMTLEKANVIILVDPSLTYTDNEQVLDRFIPTTPEFALTKDKQKIIRLMTKDSVDIYLHEMLNKKKSSVEIVNNFKQHVLNTTPQTRQSE